MSWLSGQAELGGGLHDLFEQSTADVRVAKVCTAGLRATKGSAGRCRCSFPALCGALFGYRQWGSAKR